MKDSNAVMVTLAKAVSASIQTNAKTLEALTVLPGAMVSGDDAELRQVVNDALDQLAGASIMIEDVIKQIADIDNSNAPD